MRRLAMALAMMAGLSGCEALISNTGYVPTQIQLQDIAPGRDTRETVAEKVGTPPLEDFRREDAWYYLSSRTETFAYRAPVEVDRQLVVIRFTEGGSVSNVEQFGLERGQVVVLSRRVTTPTVADLGFIQGLLRGTSLAPNLGQNDAPL